MGKNVRSSNFAQDQVSAQWEELRKKEGLAFKGILANSVLLDVIGKHIAEYRERIFCPATTLFAFLQQVLSTDRSCRGAVAQVNVDRVASGLSPASSDTGAYCRARDRLPESLLYDLLVHCGNEMEESVPQKWLWKNRHVKGVDGTTVLVNDTQENRDEFQSQSNKAGLMQLPMARCVAVFSLITGSILDLRIGPYRGEGTGELSLLRKMLNCFSRKDIVVCDAYYPAYYLAWCLQQMGADIVVREKAGQPIPYTLLQRLGKDDELIYWNKPHHPAAWMGKVFHDFLPNFVVARRCKITIEQPGFRTKHFTVITTLVDSAYASRDDMAKLYRQRWQVEVNLRSIKSALQMEYIPCKKPEMVRKEILATLIAYNLIRKLIGLVAEVHELNPLQISFKGAVQNLNRFKNLFQYSQIDTEAITHALFFS